MRITVSERLRRKLRAAFAAEGYGSKTRFVTFSKTRAGGTAVSFQALSYFLHGQRQNPLGFDDLADFAAYFHCSVADLLDDSVSLSGRHRSEKTA